jgi:hypothetical protein
MTKEQEAFFGMVLKVKNFGTKKATEMSTVPAVTLYYTMLNSMITKLIAADEGSRADLTGYAIAKATKRQLVETMGLKVSNAVAALAVVNDDVVLQKRADIPASKWYSVSEEELVTQATVIKNLAIPIAGDLVDFGATATDVTNLNDYINAFTTVMSDPTLAIDQRKEDNTTIVETIDEMRTMLSQKLDVLMRSFQVNQSSLYDLYTSARAVDINGSAQAPTATETVLPTSLKAIHRADVYIADTFYTIQNQSSELVYFGLSTASDVEASDWVPLNAGETRSRLASNLADNGVYLMVKNTNTTAATIRLWVE